jgi:hypothetical protein
MVSVLLTIPFKQYCSPRRIGRKKGEVANEAYESSARFLELVDGFRLGKRWRGRLSLLPFID